MSSIRAWEISPITLSNGLNGGTKITNEVSNQQYSYTFARSLVDGVPHPPFITEKSVKNLKNQIKFRSGDVFVCTYSKCGTTLMEQIILLLQNDGDVAKLNPLHKNTYDKTTGVGKIWPEMSVKPSLEGDDSTSNIKSQACMGENKASMSLKSLIL